MACYKRGNQMDSRRWVVLVSDLTSYILIFPQPLSRQERLEAILTKLKQTQGLIKSQALVASIEWLDNFEDQFKSGFKCTDDNLRHANRRTCPKTNETDWKRQPLPRNVIGYMSTDK